MAKLKTPLLSLGARGGLGRVLSFVRRRGQNIIEKKPIPVDAKSLAQLSWRHMYQKAVALWHALSAAEKLDWESLARPHHMTGYAYFLSQALKPNPGLYLPLQGGTMSGDIDMAKHKIEKLPTPTDSQEADTKGARDTAITAHAGQPIIHQDAPGLIAVHAAIANVHHTPPPNTFLGETDTPGSYAGEALKGVRVNAAQNALEFATLVGGIWTLAETLSPSAVTSINSSTLTARDLWMIIIDIWAYASPTAEEQIEMRFNNDSGANYDNRYVDNTAITVATGQTRIKIGSIHSSASAHHHAVGQLLVIGKSAGTSIDERGVVGIFGPAYDVRANRILNSVWDGENVNITQFNFLFGAACTGKIKIYYMDY